MTRRMKIVRNTALVLVGLLIVVTIGAVLVLRSSRFQNFVREKIIAVTEDATGGKVEIGSFQFDWRNRRVLIRDFVIHGLEPATAAPLFRARTIQLDLKLLSGLKDMVDLEYLAVDQPQANVMILPSGKTNIPEPKTKSPKSDKSPLEPIVNLAVNRFELTDGSLQFAAQNDTFRAVGQNLRAQLYYNRLQPRYEGTVSLNPLTLTSANKSTLPLNVNLPLVLEKDGIQLTNGKLTGPASDILVNARMEHLADPRTTARLNARIGLSDVSKVVDLPISLRGPNVPQTLNAEVAATLDHNLIRIDNAKMDLGQSTLVASGNLHDPSQNGALQFKGTFALAELGRLFKVEQQPEGTLVASGTAKLSADSKYSVNGTLQADNVGFRQGTTRVRGVRLFSNVAADPQRIDLTGIQLGALGGEFTGAAHLENQRQFELTGNLRGYDLRELARTFANQNLPYDGVISGPVEVRGDLKAPGTSGIDATARLAVTPGKRGVPVSGRLNADYRGGPQLIDVGRSYLTLPNSRLDLSGQIGREMQLHLVSRNLNDFAPALAMASPGSQQQLPVLQRGGNADLTAKVTGPLTAPRITSHVEMSRFAVQQRAFDQLVADINAGPSGVTVQNGALRRGALAANFNGNVALRGWKPDQRGGLAVDTTIRNADVSDLLALAGQNQPLTGTLNAEAHLTGTVGNPRGTATVNVVRGTAYDEPFDRLDAQVTLADQLITLPSATLTAGTARVQLSGSFQHPRDSMSTGRIQMHLASSPLSLEQFRTLQKQQPGLAGLLQVNADATANLVAAPKGSELQIARVDADLTARNLRAQGQNIGDLTATARTNGSVVNYNVNSNFAGSTTLVNGQTTLQRDYPTTATASIRNLPIERVLALAGRRDLQASGTFNAEGQVSGTLNDPHADVTLNVANAFFYEKFDAVQGRIIYAKDSVQIPSLTASAQGAQLKFTGSLTHPPNSFNTGAARFQLTTTPVDLAKFETITKARPGLAGIVQINADGAATLQDKPGQARVLLSTLNADASATGLQMNRSALGDAKFTARTQGTNLTFNLDSNVAGSSIRGNGQASLQGNYPMNAQVNFSNVTYAGLVRLLGSNPAGTQSNFDGLAEGQVTVAGEALRPDQLRGALQLSRLQLSAAPRNEPGSPNRRVAIENASPIRVVLDRSQVRVESAHMTGRVTDINITGTASLQDPSPLNLQVNARTNLSVLQDLRRDVYSAGDIVIQTAIRGTLSQPLINGRLELKNASVNLADVSNGISNANGLILFNGSSATIQNLTAESGGGRITMGGTVGYGGGRLIYGVRANANRVRVRTPEGASAVANANVNLTGTSERSALTGTVTVQQIGFEPQTDFGSVLSRSSPPPKVPSAPSGLLAGMRLDVRIRTSPDVTFQTALAQGLQADADLRLRGTLENPGMLGRVNITQGQLVFFGAVYTVNQGSISFYNPLRIEPVLSVDLETLVKGVDVILSVSGPVDNMRLNYRSDPPLQFNDIVALLATGRTPTSDPVIASRQPTAPPQSLEQMGASALLSQAVANPVANRLQRVFGVNQIKIDPSFTSGSGLPQARLTLQQAITSNITFTYVTNVTRANSQIIRVEWALNPRWSAVATREENGLFGIDFFYKREFR